MDIIDPRTAQDIMEEIAERARYYTPEWECGQIKGEAGTALAMIWAQMMSDVIERYNKAPEAYLSRLMNEIGTTPLKPTLARGYLCFTLLDDIYEAEVPCGTRVGTSTNIQAILETGRDLNVTAAYISSIFYVDPILDTCKGYTRKDEIPLFEVLQCQNHIWKFEHPYALHISENGWLRLEIDGDELVGEGIRWQCGNELYLGEITDVYSNGNVLMLRLPRPIEGITTYLSVILGEGVKKNISSLSVFPEGRNIIPDAIYAGDLQISEKAFFPFGQSFLPYDCMYISSFEVLSKPGALVEMIFFLKTKEVEIEGYPQQPFVRKNIMRKEDFPSEERSERAIEQVVWEYYNGTGWAVLPVLGKSAQTIFSQRNEVKIQYLIRFENPKDMAATIWGAHDAPFIRARIVNVTNMVKTQGYFLAPQIENLRFNYEYAQGIPICKARVYENLEERDVELGNLVPMSGRVIKEPAVLFVFDYAFTEGSILFELAECIRMEPLRWKYYTEKGWIDLAVNDGTVYFGETGILSYKISDSPAKITMLGVEGWWMCVVDENGIYQDMGRRYPVIKKIYENCVNAYSVNPGSQSNLPKGSYKTIFSKLQGIAKAVNPLPVSGGSDTEDEIRHLERASFNFCNLDRAITCGDMERLALSASTKVIGAKAFPMTDKRGQPSRVDTTVAIWCVESDYVKEIEDDVYKYIIARSPVFRQKSRLYVKNCEYVNVNVNLEAVIDKQGSALSIKNEIESLLVDFIDSVKGGILNNGWRIGTLPSDVEIGERIRSIKEISYIQDLQVIYVKDDCENMSYSEVMKEKFIMPKNGKHRIILRR